MGCDVHMFCEIRYGNGPWMAHPKHTLNKEDDQYYAYEIQAANRNYTMFGLLNGVRGGKALCNDNGFPDDACELIDKEYCSWGIDAHSPNHISLASFKNAVDQLEQCYKQEDIELKEDWNDALREGEITQEEYDEKFNNKLVNSKTKIEDIFYNYAELYKTIPPGKAVYEFYELPDYRDIAVYLDKYIHDNTHYCPNGLFDIVPEVRLVFWFDN